MKPQTVLLLISLVLSWSVRTSAQGWVWQNPLPQGNTLNDVHAIDESNAVAVGEYGTIIRSSNGGETWSAEPSGTTSPLRSVYFVDSNLGWAVGVGPILHTTDGGDSWTLQLGGYELWSVYFFDAKTGWAVGAVGTILHTTDGGNTWTVQRSTVSSDYLSSVYFVNSQTGWVVGYNGHILYTSNGGTTWLDQGSFGAYSNVKFTDADTGWAVGGSGILHTENGGLDWFLQSIPTTYWLYGADFADPTMGWAVGQDGTIIGTTDSGNTWDFQSSGVTNELRSVSFAGMNEGWVVGSEGVILHSTDGGATWNLQSSSTAQLFSVYSLDGTTAWAAGTSILYTTDAGSSWSVQSDDVGTALRSIRFVDPSTGWVVGDGGVISHTSDGGATWTPQSSGRTGILFDVFFVNGEEGWIAGGGGTILHTTNAGSSWRSQAQVSGFDLTSISFVDLTTGWATGDQGTILHTTNGGETWLDQASGTGRWLSSVQFVDANMGWAVGEFGTIIRTRDGGSVWTPQQSGTEVWLNSVTFADSRNGWAAGASSGTILHTTDGGLVWNTQQSGTTRPLYATVFTDATVGWAVGEGGTILHTTTGGTGIAPSEPPVLLSPPNGSRVSPSPSLTWNASPGAKWYTLQVSLTPYFVTTLVNQNEITETSFELTDLGTDTDYYWRVSVTDGVGTSPWSEIWNFNTSTLPIVTVSTDIDSLHMFVPAEGDTFAYTMSFTNNSSTAQTFDYWTTVLRPAGNPIDPLLGPVALTLQPNSTVVIDTAQLPVPYNAVVGEYALVAYVGTYDTDTLHADTTAFFKLPEIPCEDISQFQARCRPGGIMQARIILTDASHTGDLVEFTIDDVPYETTVARNGRAFVSLTGFNIGSHDVELTEPPGCYPPVVVTCPAELEKEGGGVWDDAESWEIPTTTALFDNYPNPFNPSTTFRYALSEDAHMTFRIYNMLGQVVKTLVDESQMAGYKEIVWDGSNDFGQKVASGIYMYRIAAGGFVDARRMLLVK